MTGMKPMKRFYCRAYQTVFDLGSRVLPWRKPEIVSGAGSTAKIPELLRGCGVKKVMIVSGKHTGAALVPPIRAQIEAAGISALHFDGVRANPTISIIEQVRERYLAEGCDGFLAVGGGSPMDTAKAAAARIVRPNRTVEQMTGLFKVMHALPPFIAVPTTAGSGSETTIAAVITNEKTHHKHAIMDLCLVPRFAVLDAVLTEDLPPATTAQTGMDALTHAVEAYVSVYSTTKETDRCAEEATAAIFRYLERAYANGHDLEARQEMLLASFKAGVAFTRAGVGNVHAIAHTLGGLYNTAHGLANAVILPIVLEDYGAAAEEKLARLAEITGTKTTGTAHEKSAAFIAAIRAMNERMGIPEHLDVIREEDIPQIMEEYDTLAKEMIKREKEGKGFNFFHFMIDLTGGPCVYKRLSGCGSGTEYLAVTPWGDFYPCHQFVGEEQYLMGNVDEGITKPEIQKEFGGCNVYTKKDCKDCFARFYCSGGCAANAFHFQGDIKGNYEIGCELQRKRVECAIMIKAALACD